MSLKVENISYTYQAGTPFENIALTDVSLEIQQGSFVGIIGHTGCGKSTLLQHFNGLLQSDKGAVSVDGEEMTKKNLANLRKKVGLVFQYPEYQLFEESVYKDIAYGLKNENLSPEEEKNRVFDAMKVVGLEPEMAERSIYDLSGGQKRRVALAGIIVMNPSYLVLDEPAAGLDPAGREEILGYVKKLQIERGTTIILVSHSMEDVAKLADKIFVMHESRLVMEGTPCEVFRNEEKLTEIGLAVPQVTTLWNKLRKDFPDLPSDIYTVEDAKNAILSYMGGGVK